MSRAPKPVTYDITITVSGKGGTMKTRHLKIPREKIMAPDYPDVLRKSVEVYERFVVTGKVTGTVNV